MSNAHMTLHFCLHLGTPHSFLGSLHMKGSISSLVSPSGITQVPVPKQRWGEDCTGVLIIVKQNSTVAKNNEVQTPLETYSGKRLSFRPHTAQTVLSKTLVIQLLLSLFLDYKPHFSAAGTSCGNSLTLECHM